MSTFKSQEEESSSRALQVHLEPFFCEADEMNRDYKGPVFALLEEERAVLASDLLGQPKLPIGYRSIDSYLIESLVRRGATPGQIGDALRRHRSMIEKRDYFLELEGYDIDCCLEDEIFVKPASELHPFETECGLVGGARKKKFNNNKGPFRGRARPVNRRTPNDRTGIPRNLRGADIMPPMKKVTLNYLDPLMQISAPTQSFVVKTLRINALFDPDPAILTSGVAGFNELMLFYEFFRVDKVNVCWIPSNNESFAVVVGYIFSNVNLSTLILTRQDAIDALENGITTKAKTLQNRTGGSSVCTLNRFIRPKYLLGNPSLYDGDVSYTGTANTDPADQLFVNLIVVSPANLTLLLNGTVGSLEMRFKATLFGRRYLNDALLDQHLLDRYSADQLTKAIDRKEKEKKEKKDAVESESGSEEIVVVSSRRKRVGTDKKS